MLISEDYAITVLRMVLRLAQSLVYHQTHKRPEGQDVGRTFAIRYQWMDAIAALGTDIFF